MQFMADSEACTTYETKACVVKVVVSPIIDHHGLRVRPVPKIQIDREEAEYFAASPVADVMLADLPMVIRKPVGIRLRLRQQQQTHIFIRVCAKQNHLRGLEELLAIPQVR